MLGLWWDALRNWEPMPHSRRRYVRAMLGRNRGGSTTFLWDVGDRLLRLRILPILRVKAYAHGSLRVHN